MSDKTTIQALLFDTEGILYHRPRADHHLAAFLDQYDLPLRHRKVVDRALRAARYDVQSGRITLDTFYDALLRVHGLSDENVFESGRAALRRDAADIELFPGVVETLEALREADYRLGIVSNSAHTAREKLTWLTTQGVSLGLWSVAVISSEIEPLKLGHSLIEHALNVLDVAPPATAFVGHDSDELILANDLGLMTIAFMPDDPNVEVDHVITSFYGLQNLFPTG